MALYTGAGDMTAAEARALIGVFGLIHANGSIYDKKLHGRITDVDNRNILFTDNSDEIHLFKTSKVVSFEPMEFKPKQDE